ncbi:MAG: SLC13 family permease [Pseudomonadota bacterium]
MAFFTFDQVIILSVLLGTLGMFVWGKIRYDLVALSALLIACSSGVIPFERAFLGFSHPAVIMTACILILTNALGQSGSLDLIISHLHAFRNQPILQLFVLVLGVAFCSAFMNNIGALSLILPIAIQYAHQTKISPTFLLMPLSFASLLGGLATLIGTPPNIIIANYRAEAEGQSFSMFDFAYVGGIIGLLGIFFITLIGWRLLPKRRTSLEAGEMFHIREYITEISIHSTSPLIGKTLFEFSERIPGEISVLTLFRGNNRILCPSHTTIIQEDDILVLEVEPTALKKLFDSQAIHLLPGKPEKIEGMLGLDVKMIEAIIPPGSPLIDTSCKSFYKRFKSILLAISRKGQFYIERMSSLRFEEGDILLLQGTRKGLQDSLNSTGCLPLAGRELQPVRGQITYWPLGVFACAILLSSLNILPPSIAFLSAVVILILLQKIKFKAAFESIDFSILILIGSMFPLGEALSMTGTTSMIVNTLLIQPNFPNYILITLLLVICMLLSDVINNAATALLMAPIAVELARNLGASVDPFLITVAVGSSCTFLTPIGHPSNMLVMGPGGYQFKDYWRIGLPLDIIIVIAAVPLILYVWPLYG